MGLFPNRKTTLENMKKQRALNGLESRKKVTSSVFVACLSALFPPQRPILTSPPPPLFSQAAPSVQKPAAAAQSPGHSAHPVQGESSQCSELSGHKRAQSPLSATQPVSAVQDPELPLLPHGFLPSDPGRWNIEDVYEFISALPGGCCLTPLFSTELFVC